MWIERSREKDGEKLKMSFFFSSFYVSASGFLARSTSSSRIRSFSLPLCSALPFLHQFLCGSPLLRAPRWRRRACAAEAATRGQARTRPRRFRIVADHSVAVAVVAVEPASTAPRSSTASLAATKPPPLPLPLLLLLLPAPPGRKEGRPLPPRRPRRSSPGPRWRTTAPPCRRRTRRQCC